MKTVLLPKYWSIIDIDYEAVHKELEEGGYRFFRENEPKADFPSDEDEPGSTFGPGKEAAVVVIPRAQVKSSSETPVLDNFGIDLTKAAEENKLDPIVGREREIERLAQILSRRKKNNPILIGEPGVGKSAIAEGLGHADYQAKSFTGTYLVNEL